MTFTDEQFDDLTRYRDKFVSATQAGYAVFVGSPKAKHIYNILVAAGIPMPRICFFCGNDVLRLLRKAGALYFADEAERQAAAAAAPVATEATSKPNADQVQRDEEGREINENR